MDIMNDVIQAIETYTEQISLYENMSTWYAAFAVAIIMTVIVIAIFLILKQNKESNDNKNTYNIILSGVFLIIPSIITLYLYTFSMNMRKVALYRGYLSFLENKWNHFNGEKLMLFDAEIMPRFFSFKEFLVNGLGPAVMALFVILAMISGFGLSLHYLVRVKDSMIKKVLKAVLCILAAICIFFSGLCTYFLSTNDKAEAQVIEYCER